MQTHFLTTKITQQYYNILSKISKIMIFPMMDTLAIRSYLNNLRCNPVVSSRIPMVTKLFIQTKSISLQIIMLLTLRILIDWIIYLILK